MSTTTTPTTNDIMSLNDFVTKYNNNRTFKKDLKSINNYPESCSDVEDFFRKYQYQITGSIDVCYEYHDGEDSYTSAGFNHTFPNDMTVNIEFNLFVDLDMKTAEEVYNCIIENYMKSLEIKTQLN